MYKSKKIGEATPKEKEMFNEVTSCELASKRIIEEIVQHFKANTIAKEELWEAIADRLGVSLGEYKLSYDRAEHSIYAISIEEERSNKIIEEIEINSALREHVRNKLEGKEDE